MFTKLFVLEFGLIFILIPSTAFYISLLINALVDSDTISKVLLIMFGFYLNVIAFSLTFFLFLVLISGLYFLTLWLIGLLVVAWHHRQALRRWGY